MAANSVQHHNSSPTENMIKGVHTMFYSSEPEQLRAFIRDKLTSTA